jgi:hypothetical protein
VVWTELTERSEGITENGNKKENAREREENFRPKSDAFVFVSSSPLNMRVCLKFYGL